MKNTYLLLLLFSCFLSQAQISLVQFSTGYSSPLDIQNAGDDRMFIVEQAGRIKIADTAGIIKGTFLNISSILTSGGERGLLGLAFDPDYKNNGYFYVNYTAASPVGETHISRFKVSSTNPDSAVASSEKILLKVYQPYSNHNCGWLSFSPNDGYLYIGLGDGGSGCDPGNRAQNLDSLLGKILRIDVNDTLYKIPSNNPFVGKPGRDEIWDYGMRNPFRNGFDRWNGDLWIGDVGQDAWEETDLEKAGGNGGFNYGWKCYEGNHSSTASSCTGLSGCGPISGYTGPVYEYPHSGNAAIIGGYVYRGAEYANMFGKYFLSDEFTSNYGIRTLTPNGSGGYTAALLGSLGAGTVVGFGQDRWGELYIVDYNGKIWKFKGADCSPVAYIADQDTLFINGCDTVNLFGIPLPPVILRTPEGRDFHYQWYENGSPVSASDNDSLVVYKPGDYSVKVTNRNNCTATSSTVHVLISSEPQLSINGLDTFYCVYHSPVKISGSPAGGVFSGAGIVNDSTFSPAAAGTGDYTIYYYYTDSSTACSYLDTVSIHVDECLGINESDPFKIAIFPNPNSGSFSIELDAVNSQKLNLELTDVSGRMIFSKEIIISSGKQILPFIESLSAGVYLLSFNNTSGVLYKKLIVQ